MKYNDLEPKIKQDKNDYKFYLRDMHPIRRKVALYISIVVLILFSAISSMILLQNTKTRHILNEALENHAQVIEDYRQKQSELIILQKDIEDKNSTINLMQTQIQEAQAKLDDLQANYQKAKDTIREYDILQKSFETLKLDINQHYQNLSNIKLQIQEAQKLTVDNATITENNKKLKTEQDELKQSIVVLNKEIELLNSSINAKRKEFNDLLAQSSTFTQAINSFEQMLNTQKIATTDLVNLSANMKQIFTDINQSSDQFALTVSELQTTQRLLNNTNNNFTNVNDAFKQQQHNIDYLSKSLEKSISNIDNSNQSITKVATNAGSLITTLNTISTDLIDQKNNLTNSIVNTNNSLNTLDKSISNMNNNVSLLAQSKDKLNQELLNIKTINADLNKLINSINKLIQQGANNVSTDDLNKYYALVNSQLATLEQNIEQLKQELVNFRSDTKQLINTTTSSN